MCDLSVIIPVKNEEGNIKGLANAIRRALGAMDHEVIWVDDGSTDRTKQLVLENGDERTLLVELSGNYGQSAAMAAGIDHSRGNYIAFLDGDGQNDPIDIPPMLELLKKENWDMVAGNRKKRQDGFFFRKIPSRVANSLIRGMTGVHIKDFGCTLKIFKREIAVKLNLSDGMHRFIPVLVHQMGGRITERVVQHHPRMHGKSKYGLGRIFKVIRDLVKLRSLKKHGQLPLRDQPGYTVRKVHHASKRADHSSISV